MVKTGIKVFQGHTHKPTNPPTKPGMEAGTLPNYMKIIILFIQLNNYLSAANPLPLQNSLK